MIPRAKRIRANGRPMPSKATFMQTAMAQHVEMMKMAAEIDRLEEENALLRAELRAKPDTEPAVAPV